MEDGAKQGFGLVIFWSHLPLFIVNLYLTKEIKTKRSSVKALFFCLFLG
jgi:hypothetical protein